MTPEHLVWPELSRAIADRRQLALSLIQELVRRPSYESEAAVGEFIADFWRQRGLQPHLWELDLDELRRHPAFIEVDYPYTGRSNLVVSFKSRSPVIAGAAQRPDGQVSDLPLGWVRRAGRSLALNGHLDVVPVDPAGQWEHGGPWSGAFVDGRVYGRGACDMKGGLALSMIVMDALLECGVRLEGDLHMQYVVDEENGGNGTLAALLRGYRADGTIFLEPTSPQLLVVSSRGAQFFRITVPGVEGGIEYQAVIPNAIEKAFRVFAAVQEYQLQRAAQVDDPLYAHDPTKVPGAVCTIRAGNWPSTLPAECVMEGSIECLPGEEIEDIKLDFARHIQQAAQADDWLREHPPRLEYFGLRLESSLTDPDSELVQCLSQAAAAVTGSTPLVVGGGGSDLRLPIRYAGSPSVLFGPRGGAIHSTNEYVELDSVMEVAQILGRFILDWCGAAEPGISND
jgi:acetylornithine deacetylase